MSLMTRVFAVLLAIGLVGPVAAQDDKSDPGPSLMEEGAQMFLRGLMDEMQPALRDLQDLAEGIEPAFEDFVANMGPALRDLLKEVDDWSAYHAPEVLENGDIILRRKQPEETLPEDDAPSGEIEL